MEQVEMVNKIKNFFNKEKNIEINELGYQSYGIDTNIDTLDIDKRTNFIKSLSDSELLELLDETKEEIKRRKDIGIDPTSDYYNEEIGLC